MRMRVTDVDENAEASHKTTLHNNLFAELVLRLTTGLYHLLYVASKRR